MTLTNTFGCIIEGGNPSPILANSLKKYIEGIIKNIS